MKKKYVFLAILSFFVVGLGQFIKGHVGKGIAFFIIHYVLWGTAIILSWTLIVPFITIPIAIIIWIWNIYDAYHSPA